MAMKQWFRRLQPAPLWTILALSVPVFLAQLILSHATHALTLLVDAYHMLCNLIALAGCLVTIKNGGGRLAKSDATPGDPPGVSSSSSSIEKCPGEGNNHLSCGVSSEKRLKNTFGWARVEVLLGLIGCVFLASLCLSVVVEAIQTLIHIDHQDEMHHPIPVLAIGCASLLLNGLCYLLIGGFTYNQGSFFHVTEAGDVVLDHGAARRGAASGMPAGGRGAAAPPRQGLRETGRDILGSILVMICAIIVYFSDRRVAKFVDPAISIVSAVLLLWLSYPYIKESGLILLQTIPNHIDIDQLRKKLLEEFRDIVNVHDLHVWQLTGDRVYCTAHIIFLNPKDFTRFSQDITDFFKEQGITHITIQPEFFEWPTSRPKQVLGSSECLVSCQHPECRERHCCFKLMGPPLNEVTIIGSNAEIASQADKNMKSHSNPELTKTGSSDMSSSPGGTVSLGDLNPRSSSEEVQQEATKC